MRKLSSCKLVCFALSKRRKDESVNPDFFVFKISIIPAHFSRAILNEAGAKNAARNEPQGAAMKARSLLSAFSLWNEEAFFCFLLFPRRGNSGGNKNAGIVRLNNTNIKIIRMDTRLMK